MTMANPNLSLTKRAFLCLIILVSSMLLVSQYYRFSLVLVSESSCQLVNDWGNRPMYSALAKKILHNQLYAKSGLSWLNNQYGMGSDIHTYSHGLCQGLDTNQSLWVIGSWIWADQNMCKHKNPFVCYWGEKMKKPGDLTFTGKVTYTGVCKSLNGSSKFRAAAMEYLFTNLSSELTAPATDFFNAMVKKSTKNCATFRENMITVHIRWGDKWREMALQSISNYTVAIELLVKKHRIKIPIIFLTTEDMRAYSAMKEYVSKQASWFLFTYSAAISNNYGEKGYPLDKSHISPMYDAKKSSGRQGSQSLISLLISLEAKHYVVTTGSNWSRLINELRLNVRNMNCNNCTDMIDLQYGEW